jgi:23S rRNA (uracil1939-C5)-methyltransferase
MKKGDEITLQMEGLSGEGKSIARFEGMVVFVQNAVPGDTVQAVITRIKRNFCEAKALQVVIPSKDRTNPRCKHFGVCGGCKWQNFSYSAQLIEKRKLVADAFERIGGFENPNIQDVIGCGNSYFYRNKMEFTFSRSRWLTVEEMNTPSAPDEGIALGLHVPRRYDKVLDLQECWLQSELSTEILQTVRLIARQLKLTVYSTETHDGYLRHLAIRQSKHTPELMVNLVTTDDAPQPMSIIANELIEKFPQITTVVNNITARKSMVAFGDAERVYHGPGYITERIGSYTFRISANSFFQTNTLQTEVLYSTAKQLANLQKSDVVYDLYSGTGSIAIFLSDAVERVIGIELIESSVNDAQRNAELNGISNCYFLQGDLKDRLTKEGEWINEHPRATVIFIDPPRSGMHPKVVSQIVKLAPEKIIYISCNPSTQARDAKMLASAGYVLKIVQPVDMFPHTDHVEAVAVLMSEL